MHLYRDGTRLRKPREESTQDSDKLCKHLQIGDCPSCYQEKEESSYQGRGAAEYMRDNPPDWHEKPKPEDETEESSNGGDK